MFQNPGIVDLISLNQREQKLYLILDYGWVYEGYLAEIQAVLLNTTGLLEDFYIVSKQYEWVLAHSDDGMLCACTKERDVMTNEKYYYTWYPSPVGQLTIACSANALIGIWLKGYFNGARPKSSELLLRPQGSEFQQIVWKLLCEIPYGETITYGELAKKVAAKMGRKSMFAQAVGGAVGRNPISIVIPCHRVIGADGELTGYAGGLGNKRWLLELEKGCH